uniref:Uncharacterized protein n=1 Tax=Kalanchoe fedtschenkoi TaxID=63787 RepID=A0A7N0VJG3_KALFE
MTFGWRPFGSRKKAAKCLSEGLTEKMVNCEQHVSGAASLEEVFFDSQVWLDSDIEDYFSVDGDFTPSRDNTPIHPRSVVQAYETQYADKNLDIGPITSSPSDGKKRLSELFGESLSDEKNSNSDVRPSQEAYRKMTRDAKPEVRHVSSQHGSPYASVTSSICSSTERTPTKGLKRSKYKSGCSSPCCLPSLARSLSFGEKKKRLVPSQA